MEQHPVLRDATSPVLRLLRRLCAAAPGADEFVALLWRIWRWLCARRHGAAPATVGVTLPLDGCSQAALGVDEDEGGSSIKNRVTDDDDDGGGSIKNRLTEDDGGSSIKNRVTDDDDDEDDGGGSIKNRATDDDGGSSIKNRVTDDDEDDGGGSIKNRVTDDDGGSSIKNRVTDEEEEDGGGGSIKNRVTDDDGEDDNGGSSINNRVTDEEGEDGGGGSIKNRATDDDGEDDAGKNKRRLGIERPTPAADPGDDVPTNLLQDADLAGAAADPDDFPSELLRDADLAGPAALGIISKDKKAGKERALGTFKNTMIPVQKPPALAPWGSTPTPAGRAPRAVEEEEEERRAMHLKYVKICSSLRGQKTYCFSCFMESEIDPAKKGKKPAKILKNKDQAEKHMDAWHKSNSIPLKCSKTGCFAMSRIRQDISHHEKYAHGC
ncbi:clumping factor A [Triticum aestivum]|uniref:clumping factor A n=1 Tax=Triticum aestivum TaxID=4565 RepID=UPI001D00651D|nr:clumping factor A-like [Triticum aestivum]